MHILLVADGRSPTTRRWVQMLAELNYEITLVSTFPCAPLEGVQADRCMPVAFGNLAGSAGGTGQAKTSALRRWVRHFRGIFMAGRYRLGPLTLYGYGPRFARLAAQVKPDLIHALRIPFEGMLAAYAPKQIPLAVSIWGNDLTLHAPASRAMAGFTRRTLSRANGLHSDTLRDVRLAHEWGLDAAKPVMVVPGSGGLRMAEIEAAVGPRPEWLPPTTPLVLNPRGFRTGSVRNDTFFAAIPLVLQRRPEVSFACAAMAGHRDAERLVDLYHLQGKVQLLPHMPQDELWALMKHASVSVSISQHDGTPNSLLEAMALGCFPIAGDIESLREWITPGVNGLLVPPDQPQLLAEAILSALENADLRARAAAVNAQRIAQQAVRAVVSEQVQTFYQSLMV